MRPFYFTIYYELDHKPGESILADTRELLAENDGNFPCLRQSRSRKPNYSISRDDYFVSFTLRETRACRGPGGRYAGDFFVKPLKKSTSFALGAAAKWRSPCYSPRLIVECAPSAGQADC